MKKSTKVFLSVVGAVSAGVILGDLENGGLITRSVLSSFYKTPEEMQRHRAEKAKQIADSWWARGKQAQQEGNDEYADICFGKARHNYKMRDEYERRAERDKVKTFKRV